VSAIADHLLFETLLSNERYAPQRGACPGPAGQDATYWRGLDLGRSAMSDVLDLESRDTPFPVALAGMIGLAKAALEVLFGVLGLAIANSVDDSFGGGVLAFGIVYAIASILLLRGSRFGYFLSVALATLGLVVALAYMFRSEAGVVGAMLVIAFFNALVLYLLLGTRSARAFFGLGAG
jgi:hypothetical protein